MNDRFKFRAWDEGTKTYFDNAMIETLAPVRTFVKNGWVVEQCTGLKDKNGNLIYENDIIEIIGNGGKKLHFRVAVSDRNGGYYFPDSPLGYSFDFFDSHLYEVVGNIHENPELLQEK